MNKEILTKKELEEFVKSIPDLREDFHEGSDLVIGYVIGETLDNEGFDHELKLTIADKKSNNWIEIRLATLLGMAMGYNQ